MCIQMDVICPCKPKIHSVVRCKTRISYYILLPVPLQVWNENLIWCCLSLPAHSVVRGKLESVIKWYFTIGHYQCQMKIWEFPMSVRKAVQFNHNEFLQRKMWSRHMKIKVRSEVTWNLYNTFWCAISDFDQHHFQPSSSFLLEVRHLFLDLSLQSKNL